MRVERAFGVIGGDRRQAELAKLLAAEGNPVRTYGLDRWLPGGETCPERAAEADVVILPLPLCKEEGILNCAECSVSTRELFACMRGCQLALAGQVKPAQQREAEECGVVLRDYFLREELTVANAAATAEAAVRVAGAALDCTWRGIPCLVLGFGRIGKLLSHHLCGVGADVTAAARKLEDLAWIRAYGYRDLRIDRLRGHLERFRVVFNTVPAPVLTEVLLAQLPKGCLCLDLASERGIDPVGAAKRGIPLLWERGLPGRIVPRTAAEAILQTMYAMILEERSDSA